MLVVLLSLVWGRRTVTFHAAKEVQRPSQPGGPLPLPPGQVEWKCEPMYICIYMHTCYVHAARYGHGSTVKQRGFLKQINKYIHVYYAYIYIYI